MVREGNLAGDDVMHKTRTSNKNQQRRRGASKMVNVVLRRC